MANAIVVMLAIVMLVAGVIAIVSGASLFFPSLHRSAIWNVNPATRVVYQTLGNVAGYVLLALAAVCLCSGIGLFWRRKWAWWAALVLLGLDAVGELIRLLGTHENARYGAAIVVAVCFIVLLTLPGVRGQMDMQ